MAPLIMAPLYRHGFSTENENQIHGESDINLTQEMYEKPKIVVVRAVYNSKNVKVMLRRPLQSERVKVVFTLKPRFFRNGENSVNIEEQFQKLLRRLSCLNMSELIEE